MTTVGSYEAKTHLAELLERVEKGERFTITRRGRPVAMLVPAETASDEFRNVVQGILRCRDSEGPRLGKGVSIRQLIERGRRY